MLCVKGILRFVNLNVHLSNTEVIRHLITEPTEYLFQSHMLVYIKSLCSSANDVCVYYSWNIADKTAEGVIFNKCLWQCVKGVTI